ncbi:DLA class II histocompatibility antigen, DR-1 beta chain-like [Erythrolamprus reginae]|uniref:DLA class II histocompatibility antigen, DR-1 beta chain-like n=1 Tax=Erythrolamprus reginae TaxID=121349 RepID=UPI00396C43E4
MALVGVPLVQLVGALARIPGSEGGKETPAHFLAQEKGECHFLNGTQQVRLLWRYIYDRQEIVRFDSDCGEFKAITEFGKATADAWNRDKLALRYRKAAVDSFCRNNYKTAQSASVVGQRDSGRFQAHRHNLPPQRGDVYTCKVEHASLEAPITVQWEPRSSRSARAKIWMGIMGAVIGVAFLAVGFFSYLKAKKAIPIQPPAENMPEQYLFAVDTEKFWEFGQLFLTET